MRRSAPQFAILARKGKSRAWFAGRGIDTDPRKAKRYRTAALAMYVAKRIAGSLPSGWKCYVTYAPKRTVKRRRHKLRRAPRRASTATRRRKTHRRHGGGRRRNPVTPLNGGSRQVADARALFSRFTGHKAGHVRSVRFDVPKAATAFGVLDYVGYTTVRDGKREEYEHDFQRDPQHRPALAASPDGKQLLIVGGRYKFGHRGIENVHEAR